MTSLATPRASTACPPGRGLTRRRVPRGPGALDVADE